MDTTQTTTQNVIYEVQAVRLRNEFPAEPPHRLDPYSAYIEVEVCVVQRGGERDGMQDLYEVATVVGVPEYQRGSMLAAGSGVTPFVTAWFDDPSDTEDLPWRNEPLRDAVEWALKRESRRLYREAMSDRADEDEDDN